MIFGKELLAEYENTRLIHHTELEQSGLELISFDELPTKDRIGFIKACFYGQDGKLKLLCSKPDSHALLIGATGMGKTTGGLIPNICAFANLKNPPTMIIADPKGELQQHYDSYLKERNYKTITLSFRDPIHSEKFNIIGHIYDLYIKAYEVENEVEVVKTDNGLRNKFDGVIFDSQSALDFAIEQKKQLLKEDAYNAVDELATKVVPMELSKDMYWPLAAQALLKAIVYGMLEDIFEPGERPKITRETFSMNTVLAILNSICCGESSLEDRGFFTTRPDNSRALSFANYSILHNSPTTRRCVIGELDGGLNPYKSSVIRMLTCASSFDFSELVEGKQPIALFINFPDETKTHYMVISQFLQSCYTYLIKYANNCPDGKLAKPIYFMLDEFGNMPAFQSFDCAISACRSRNIFFMIVLQSYAQLDSVYGPNVAEVVRDNVNTHLFLGSNNPQTLEKFSCECGEFSRISPQSVLQGNSNKLDALLIEQHVSCVPKSRLATLGEGECVVTEANCGYVLLSHIERSYKCKEFSCDKLFDLKSYISHINPFDRKYVYQVASARPKRKIWLRDN